MAIDLSSAIDVIVLNSHFKEITIDRLKDMNTRADLINKRILDYRVHLSRDKNVMFGGLSLDSRGISTQTYVIKNKMNNIGVFTLILTPKEVVSETRYIIRNDEKEKLYIGDFLSLGCTNQLPDFIFEFGYTALLPRFRKLSAKSSIKMINIYNNIYQLIRKNCPPNTWIEIDAAGTFKYKDLKSLNMKVNETKIGEDIPYNRLGFDIHKYDFSKNTRGSNITVWFAEKKLKLNRMNGNITRIPAMGPIFVGKMR